jgi:integrase
LAAPRKLALATAQYDLAHVRRDRLKLKRLEIALKNGQDEFTRRCVSLPEGIIISPPPESQLIEATKDSRNPERDRCLILLMYRHGLRVSEACRLRLNQADTKAGYCMLPG